ncbi:MAG: transcriptional regulator GcvA [Rhodospirillales bacterium]
MIVNLPPLKALRAFEAAFRHESFIAAARELNVTPSAISHQIKLLEDALGLPLFRREVRAVVPTAAARAAYPGVRRGFEELAGAVARIRPPKPGPLVLSCVPSFATKWLIPRLDRRPAGLQVQIVATRDRADLIAGEADMAIRFGMGDYPGLAAHRLFDEMVVPLAAPALLAAGGPLARPRDLGRVTLLHDDSITFDPLAPDWRSWLAAAGCPDLNVDDGPRFTAPENVLQAAIAGTGVALGRWSLAAEDIDAGRLVVPFGPSLALQPAYYLLSAAGRAEAPECRLFRDWLLAEVDRFQARPGRTAV